MWADMHTSPFSTSALEIDCQSMRQCVTGCRSVTEGNVGLGSAKWAFGILLYEWCLSVICFHQSYFRLHCESRPNQSNGIVKSPSVVGPRFIFFLGTIIHNYLPLTFVYHIFTTTLRTILKGVVSVTGSILVLNTDTRRIVLLNAGMVQQMLA